MLPPLPAILRYRAENFPDGYEPIQGPEGLELHRVQESPRSSVCVHVFQGTDALTQARKKAWELNEALGDHIPW